MQSELHGAVPTKLSGRPDWGFALALGLGMVVVLLFLTGGQADKDYHTDEGIEVMKARLWLRGEPLYGALWNDQPPLHTLMLGGVFRCWGESVASGRIVSILFAGLLVALLALGVRRSQGRPVAGLAVVIMMAFPTVFILSGAVLMSLPAYALACLAAAWVWSPVGGRVWLQMLTGGMVFGLALQTKLTGLLLAPPILLHWVVMRGERGIKFVGQSIAMFSLGTIAAWALVQQWATGESVVELLRLHFDNPVRAAFAGGWEYMTLDAALLQLWPFVALAVIGGAVLVVRREPEHLFPVWMLVTAYLAHRMHRPFWNFYLLHFALPLGWLAAIGAVASFRYFYDGGAVAAQRQVWRWLGGLGTAALLGSGVVQTVDGWSRGVTELRPDGDLKAQELQAWIKGVKPVPVWLVIDRPMIAFRLGLRVPPELCVISKKRLLAGRLTASELAEIVVRRRPELIAWPRHLLAGPEWASCLATNYSLETTIGEWQCFRRNHGSDKSGP